MVAAAGNMRDNVIPSLDQLREMMGAENVFSVGDKACILAEKHASVVRDVIDFGEGRMKFWMTALISVFCFAICLAYYFLNKDVRYYKAKYLDMKTKYKASLQKESTTDAGQKKME
jgi:hypothetical protein